MTNFTSLFFLMFTSNYNININNLTNNTNNPSCNLKLNIIYNFILTNSKQSTIQNLKNNQILYIEQLLIADNQYLLLWNNIYLWTHKSPRGPIPSWNKYIKNLITNNSLYSVWLSIQLKNINPFINTLTLISTPSTISKKNN